MNAIEIGLDKLILSCVLVIIVGITSYLMRLKLEKEIFIAGIRSIAQLFLVGLALSQIFTINNIFLILLGAMWMIFWASFTINSRVKGRPSSIIVTTFFSMFVCSLATTIFATKFIIGTDPFKPQYFIPILGMILGNSMNGITISLNNLVQDLKSKKHEINLFLFLGANYKEATEEVFHNSVRAGLIPIINMLMTVGLVSLPGMMTGQILAGEDPMNAIKYQLIIMFLILVSLTFCTIITTYIIRAKCFTKDEVLLDSFLG